MPVSDIINIISILYIGFGITVGYFSGFRKRCYKFILIFALFFIGLLLLPLFAGVIGKLQLPKFLEFTIEDIKIKSLPQAITDFSKIYLKPNIRNITLYQEMIDQIILMVSRGLALLIWIFLFMPPLYLVLTKLIDKALAKKQLLSDSPKNGFFKSMMGAFHSLAVLFVLSVPFSGFFQIQSDIACFTNTNTSESVNYQKTVPGILWGIFETNDRKLYEYYFDQVFYIDYQDHKIAVRKELKIASEIYLEIKDFGFSIDALSNIDDQSIQRISEKFQASNSIQFLIPFGIEYAIANGYIDSFLEGFSSNIDLKNLMKEARKIDYQKEIVHLLPASVSICRLQLHKISEPKDFIALDKKEFMQLLSSIGQMELTEVAGVYFSDYMDTSEAVRLYNQKIPIQAINLSNINWNQEIQSFERIIRILFILSEKDISEKCDEEIISFVDALFQSRVFVNNQETIANYLWEFLSDEYRRYLDLKKLQHSDYIACITLGRLLYSLNLLEKPDYSKVFSETAISEIAMQISSSKLLADNFQGILQLLINRFGLDGLEIRFPNPSIWHGEIGKQEIKTLLTNAGILMQFGSDKEEDCARIRSLGYSIYQSELLRDNINPIIRYLAEDRFGYDGELNLTIEWNSQSGQEEFRNLMNAISVIYKSGLTEDFSFESLSDGSTDTNYDGLIDGKDENMIRQLSFALSESELIKRNLSPLISSEIAKYDSQIIINLPLDSAIWNEKEIFAVLKALKTLEIRRHDLSELLRISETDLNIFFDSYVITEILIQLLLSFNQKQFEPLPVPISITLAKDSPLWRDTKNSLGELRKLFNGVRLLFRKNTFNPDIFFRLTDGTKDTNDDGIIDDKDSDEISKILESKIISENLVSLLMEVSKEAKYTYLNYTIRPIISMRKDDAGWYGKNGELRNLIQALKTIFKDYDSFENRLNLNLFKNITTGSENPEDDDLSIILKSRVVTETLIHFLKSLHRTQFYDTILIVDVEDGKWLDSPNGEPGELRKLIRGCQLIVRDVNLNYFRFSYDMILRLTDGSKDTNGDGVINEEDSNELEEVSESKIISDCVIQMFYEMIKDEYEKQKEKEEKKNDG